jgi:SAM-dependent methyltransferase
MARDVDILTSFTLKHLRDRWWDASFTEFLRDALLPQTGERVLDIGCGAGTAELILTMLQPGGARFVGIDIVRERVRDAQRAAIEHALPATLATADAAALPFAAQSIDAAFAVCVLQHVERPTAALAGLARVLRPGGRLVIVEPDNAARYWFSEPAAGHETFALATQFFSLLEESRREQGEPSLGPRIPGLLRVAGFDVLAMHLFPVTATRVGAPVDRTWAERRAQIARGVEAAADESLARLGRDLLASLDRYAAQARAAGPAFLEVQNTMLFATIAHRRHEEPRPPRRRR